MNTYIRVLKYVKPYKLLLALALCSSMIFVFLNSSSVWIIGSLVNKVMLPTSIGKLNNLTNFDSTVSINEKLNYLIDILVGSGTPVDQLKMLCVLLLFIYIGKNIFFYLSNISISYIQNRMIKDIRDVLFAHINNLSISFFDKTKSAEMSSILIRDVTSMRAAFTQSIQKLIIEPINILVFLILLFIISPKMTLMIILTIPISTILVIKIGKSIRRKAKRSSKQIAGVMNTLQETITGIRIVKAFSMEKFEVKKFMGQNLKYFKLVFRQARLKHLTTPINDIIGVCIGVILLWYGGTAVLSGQGMSPEDFMRYIILLFAMMQPIRSLANVNAQIQSGLASADRVFGILDIPITIKNSNNAVSIDNFEKSIEFNNVTFQYENNSNPSLYDINITIDKGSMIALVGMSGAGKSTFVDLIPRFYEPTNGKIIFDEIDYRKISLESLRSLMGIVTQETILFNDTISNNIGYGIKDTPIEKVKSAAIAANAHEFIEKLPLGYNTIIGERGTRLSGGQRQRLSIARAIFKNPPIIILDEATSALDFKAEKKVQKAIHKLMEDRTVIIIAHRLSTVIDADKIIVFDNGRIIESGNHKILLSNNTKYSELFKSQFESSDAKN